ncbi:flagellar hook-length control protein FliK [Sphingomonas sp.]|uniref:flagellar hook-length control protein FliK n=1 Tax=Sphingomonas sp. TaxID=28214 RepID=UPI002ED9D006
MIQLAASPLVAPAGPARPILLAAQSGASNFALALSNLLMPAPALESGAGDAKLADASAAAGQFTAESGKDLPQIDLDSTAEENPAAQYGEENAPERDELVFAWLALPGTPAPDMEPAEPVATIIDRTRMEPQLGFAAANAPVGREAIATSSPVPVPVQPVAAGAGPAVSAKMDMQLRSTTGDAPLEREAAPAPASVGSVTALTVQIVAPTGDTQLRSTAAPAPHPGPAGLGAATLGRAVTSKAETQRFKAADVPVRQETIAAVEHPQIGIPAPLAEASAPNRPDAIDPPVPQAAFIRPATAALKPAAFKAAAAAPLPESGTQWEIERQPKREADIGRPMPSTVEPPQPLTLARSDAPPLSRTPLRAAAPEASVRPASTSAPSAPGSAAVSTAPAFIRASAPPHPAPAGSPAQPVVVAAYATAVTQPLPDAVIPEPKLAPSIEAPVEWSARQPARETVMPPKVGSSPIAERARQPAASAAVPLFTPPPIAQPLLPSLAPTAFSPLRRELREPNQLLVNAAAAASPTPLQQVAATPDAQQGALDMRRQEWMGQMVERIEALRDAAPIRETRISLMPDALGKVEVSVRHDGDRIHVHFATETQAARQILMDAQPRLNELAEARGIRLGHTNVDSQGTQSGQRQNDAPRQQAPAAPARARTEEDRSTTDERVA